MMRCIECQGKGYLQDNQPIQTSINSNTFTNKATANVRTCPTCLGAGYSTGHGA